MKDYKIRKGMSINNFSLSPITIPSTLGLS